MSLPNPSVALVDAAGLPTDALLGVLPDLKANEAVVSKDGTPTRTFSQYLQGRGGILPNASVPLTLRDGTATRSLVYLLMAVT